MTMIETNTTIMNVNSQTKTKTKIFLTSRLSREGDFFDIQVDWNRQDSSDTCVGQNQIDRALNEVFGRMHFTTGGTRVYPLIPGYLSFARSSDISEDVRIEEKIQTEVVVEEIDPAVLRAAIENSIREKLRGSLTDRSIGLMIDPNVGSIGNIDIDPELVPEVLDQIGKTASLVASLITAKRKARRKVKKETKVLTEISGMTFQFETADSIVELRLEGFIADIFRNLRPIIETYRDRVATLRRWRNEGVREDEKDFVVRGEFEPMDHQWAMYKAQVLFPKFANLSEMGTGKTYSVLMTIDKLFEIGEVARGKVLVVCPPTLMENWEKEVRRHTPGLTTRILTGSYQERLMILLSDTTTDIFLVNYEAGAMSTKLEGQFEEVEVLEVDEWGRKRMTKKKKAKELPFTTILNIIKWEMVVFDEAHKLKNPDAKRTGNFMDIFRCDIQRKIIMSGTINANKLYDLHSPFVLLNHARNFNSVLTRRDGVLMTPGELRGDFEKQLINMIGGKPIPKPGALAYLRRGMEECSIRYEKAECMTLPPKMYEMRMVDLEPTHLKLYEALKMKLSSELLEMINAGTYSHMNALALMTKLAEAANGWIKNAAGQIIEFPWNGKLDALVDIVDELPEEEKVVMWSRFTQDLHKIAGLLAEKYGRDSVEVLHGGVHCSVCGASQDDRFASTIRFNDTNSPVRFMVANPQAGGHGIDLTGATYEIFFSNSYSKTDRKQAEDRCHRLGMQDRLTIIDVVATSTIDVDILDAMSSWKTMSMALLGHLGVRIDPMKMKELMSAGAGEEPVIIAHEKQDVYEKKCALKTIMMLSHKTEEEIVSAAREDFGVQQWADLDIRGHVAMFKRFLPALADQYEEWMKKQWSDDGLGRVIDIPTSGYGAVSITQKGRKRAHMVAFESGMIYDPNESGPVPIGEWLAKVSAGGWFVRNVMHVLGNGG